jgi:hypothetical protein
VDRLGADRSAWAFTHYDGNAQSSCFFLNTGSFGRVRLHLVQSGNFGNEENF